jgi:AraC-like DNA-binding protein
VRTRSNIAPLDKAEDRGRPSVEAVDIWPAPGFGSIQLHRGQKVTQAYPRHWHDELYFGAILGGTGTLEYAGSSHATPRGTLMVIPPGEVHANTKEECSFRCMFLDCETAKTVFENFAERRLASLSFRGALVKDARTVAEFAELHRVLEAPHSTLKTDSAVSHFLYNVVLRYGTADLPSSSTTGQEDVSVQRIRQFIHDRYADRLTLKKLSREANLSPFHLKRAFCRSVGMPPHAYQIQIRVSRAKSFLRSGRAIAETALATGFVDQSHFSYQFRKFVGVTPGQYIRLSKKIQDCR